MVLHCILFYTLLLLEVVYRTTIAWTFHKAGLDQGAANHMKCCSEFAKRHVGDSSDMWKKVLWTHEIKPNFLALAQSSTFGRNPALPFTLSRPSPE